MAGNKTRLIIAPTLLHKYPGASHVNSTQLKRTCQNLPESSTAFLWPRILAPNNESMESRALHSQNSNHLSKVSNASPAPVQTSVKKRRTSTSTSTSRGVANLTPEQLAKKRANDREAQRAIRERTKGQIENLERRIQELTTQKPYEELQHVVREKQLVKAENEDIKRQLKSVLSIIQPLVAANGFGGMQPRELNAPQLMGC